MDHQNFESAPDLREGFDRSVNDTFEQPLEYDAERWEAVEEPEIERPSEKHLEMHLTPGGTLEQEVHTELDQAARKRILGAQKERHGAYELQDEAELDFASDFEQAAEHEAPAQEMETNEWSSRKGVAKSWSRKQRSLESDWRKLSQSRGHDEFER